MGMMDRGFSVCSNESCVNCKEVLGNLEPWSFANVYLYVLYGFHNKQHYPFDGNTVFSKAGNVFLQDNTSLLGCYTVLNSTYRCLEGARCLQLYGL